MENLFSESFVSLSWLISYTRDVSILICLIFLIKFIAWKRLPAWWSYSLWLMLLVRMLIPWRIENRLNISNLLNVEIDTDIMRLMLMGKETGTIDLTAAASSSSGWWQGWNLSIDQTLLILWVAGAVAFGIYILLKNTGFWIMIRGRAALTEKKTLGLLEECKARLKINRPINVIITDKVKSPALFGYFHPRLLLPEGILEDFSDDQIAYVFMHELGHLKRHDIAVSCLVTLFQIIHWFNPLVWLAFYQMRIDQESACDSSVLSRRREHQTVEYASAIIGFLERYCQNRQLPCMAGILENKTQMKRRLTMIVNYKRLSIKMSIMAVALLITTGFIFFTLTGFAETQGQAELDQAASKVLKDASQALQTSNYIEAEKFLEDYLNTNPGNVSDTFYLMLSYAYSFQHKYDEALNVLDEGHDVYPDNEDITRHILNVQILRAVEDREFNEAAMLYQELHEKIPNDKRNLALAVNSYAMAGNLNDAHRLYNKLIGLIGDDLDVSMLEMLVEISAVIGLEEDAQGYKDSLREKGVYSNVLSSGSAEVDNKQSDNVDTDKVYTLSSIDTPPRVLKAVPPQYPFLAKQENIQGRVTLQFIVTKEGIVRDAKITESDPEGMFDEAAIAAIEQYIFEPATKDREAVNCIVHAPMAFRLK